MADATRTPPPPRDWHAAMAALPPEPPPPGGWARLSARLEDRRHRQRRLAWLATAAAAVLAIALPWQLQRAPEATAPATADITTPPAPAVDALQRLHAESAQLESLLLLAGDDRVASGTAAALAGELEARIASIDAALMQPGLSSAQQLRLWQDRVDALRAAAGFEGTRRWLAAHGGRYDASLLPVD